MRWERFNTNARIRPHAPIADIFVAEDGTAPFDDDSTCKQMEFGK